MAALLTEAKERIRSLELEKEVWADLSNRRPEPPPLPEPPVHAVDAEKRLAVPVLCLSDIHAGAIVEPTQVSGLNEYNLVVAAERLRWFFKNATRLIELDRHEVRINTALLWIGGDLISGIIHDDLSETNELGVVDTLVWVRDRLLHGIRELLEHVHHLHIVCTRGNHGRVTKKPRVHTGDQLSFEQLLFFQLRSELASEPRVKFLISKGTLLYVDVLDMVIRFTHGDAINYFGGVGGVSIPINKAVASWDKGTQADYTVLGHFHQLQFGPRFLVNGSVIGYDSYAEWIKASYEPPQQAKFLVLEGQRAPVRFDRIFLKEV